MATAVSHPYLHGVGHLSFIHKTVACDTVQYLLCAGHAEACPVESYQETTCVSDVLLA